MAPPMRRKPPVLLLMPLLLATLLVRALMPAGWMPVAVSDGIVMTLCGGDGAARIDAGHTPSHPPPHEAPCAFTAMAPLLPDTVPLPILLLVAIAATVVVRRPSFLRLPHRRSRPPGQGPPARQPA